MLDIFYSNINIDNSSPYTPLERGFAIFHTIYQFVGFACSSFLLASFFKQRNLPIDSQYILQTIICDWIFSITVLSVSIPVVASNQWRFGDSKMACFIMAAILLISTVSFCFFLALLTAHRYAAVVWQSDWSQRVVTISILAGWGLCCVMIGFGVLLQPFIESGKIIIELRPSQLYCLPSFKIDQFVGVASAMIIGTFCWMVFAYSKIVLLFRKLYAKKKAEERIAKERLLITKAVCICLSYAVCWICILGAMLFEYSTQTQVSHTFDFIIGISVCTNPIINAVVLYMFDGHIRLQIHEFLAFFTGTESGPSATSGKPATRIPDPKLIKSQVIGLSSTVPYVPGAVALDTVLIDKPKNVIK